MAIITSADADPVAPGHLAVASASAYLPDARRRQVALSIFCPYCGQIHLGRVRSPEEANGVRRMACGRLALVVVRRYYGRACRQRDA